MTKALPLYHFQNDYFENGKVELAGPEKASQNAKTILEFFRNKNSSIVYM
jgi:nicotinamidase-related amidase